MKKILIGLAALATLAITAGITHTIAKVPKSPAAHGWTFVERSSPALGFFEKAFANTATPPYRAYEKTVAAGAIINSDILDVTGCDDVQIYADNSLGGSTRALTVSVYAADGTTILWQPPAASLTTGLRWAFNFSRYASAGAANAASTVVPQMPGPKIGASLAAAGAAAGTVAIYCR